MTPYEIPLTPNAQVFNISLGGTEYQLRTYWCDPSGCWNLDIYDATGITPQITSIPLVTGVDLLAQYGYMNWGGQLIAQTDGSIYVPPTSKNLGSTGRLYFVTNP